MKLQTANGSSFAKFILAAFFALLIIQFQPATAFGFDDEWSEETEMPFSVLLDGNDDAAASANAQSFYGIVNGLLIKRGWKKEELCDGKDLIINRIMREYGSVYVVIDKALPPPIGMFASAEEVENFQKKAGFTSAEIDGAKIELQPAAMEALLKARDAAQQQGLDITPRDGAEAGRRNYADTIRLWKSRFEPACDHWLSLGRLTAEQVTALKALPIKDQVREVLNLESQGIYFNKFFNNSILFSVAAPGTSQHLSMLALDINEYDNPAVRAILAEYGWFQTVRNDTPHFTFLGHKQELLKTFGLKKVMLNQRDFWIPNA